MDGTAQSSPPASDGEGFFSVSAPADGQPAAAAAGQAPDPAAGAPGPGAGSAPGNAPGNSPAGKDPATAPGERRGVFAYEGRDGKAVEFQVRDDLLNEDGTLNAIRAAKQATDLRAKLSARGLDPDAEAVKPPEAYSVTVPEDLADLVHVGEPDPANPKPITIGPDDPLLKAMTPVLQELGLGQEQADKLIGAYLGLQADGHRQSQELAAEDDRLQTEMVVQAFGSREAARQAMNGELGPWLASMMTGDETMKQMKYAVLSEAGKVGPLALALHDVYQRVRGHGMAAPPPGQGAPQAITRDDLREMMRTDAYNTPSHPEYEAIRRKVTAGYANLKGDV